MLGIPDFMNYLGVLVVKINPPLGRGVLDFPPRYAEEKPLAGAELPLLEFMRFDEAISKLRTVFPHK